ncbi:MAG: hypothetical protein ACPG5P_03065, partial [Saprospiraceae bacterium]
MLSKKSCGKFCFQKPGIIEAQGTKAMVSVGWLDGDTATGTFLGREIVLGTGGFTGISTFISSMKVWFPDLTGAEYTVLIDNQAKLVLVEFPATGEYQPFEFGNATVSQGHIGTLAQNGTDADVAKCIFDVRVYDEEDIEISRFPTQHPKFSGNLLTEDTCVNKWDYGLSTTFPPEEYDISIDQSYSMRILVRSWIKCEGGSCGYQAEQMVYSPLYTVINAVHEPFYDFKKHSVITAIQGGYKADFLTEIKDRCINRNTDDWLWFCPNLEGFTNPTPTLGALYTFYDENEDVIGSSQRLISDQSGTVVIPSGFNYVNPSIGTKSYTIKIFMIIDGNMFEISNPVKYHITDCQPEATLYFKERLGCFSYLYFDSIKKKGMYSKGEPVSIGENCEMEILNVSNTSAKEYVLYAKWVDGAIKELFSLATEFYMKIDGNYQRVS